MTSRWVASHLRCHFEWHMNLMVPGHPQMILGACRDRMHEIKVSIHDRIPSTTPGAEPPRDARDSGSARSHSTQLETSSSDRP